jgi:hypothetical protein
MRTRLVVAVIGIFFVAAIQAVASTLPDSCGNDKIKFEVKTSKGQPAPDAADIAKAQIILLESENQMIAPFHNATVRWGMDQSWVGADYGNSYFVLSIDPGVHHLCASWQSALRALKKNVDLTSFTAEPGHTYYFLADVNVESQYAISFAISQLNDDKGQYLVKNFAQSTSKPK